MAKPTRQSERSSLPLQPRDYLILLALADGERHGYGLIKEIENLTEGGVRMDPANLHRALQRLVRDGWVQDLGRLPAAEERRRYYAITEAGTRLARAEAARLDKLSAVARTRLMPGSEASR